MKGTLNLDVAFVNGNIHALDDIDSTYQAVGASRGIIVALGSNNEVKRLVGTKTEVIDLKGATMFPGFMEAHSHLSMHAYLISGIDLSSNKASKIKDIVRLVKNAAEQVSEGTWIKGSRYAEYYLAENRHPTRYDLDPISPHHPVILLHTSLHACVLNSVALNELGITRETTTPKGGISEYDPETGELSGVFHDAAKVEIFRQIYSRDLNKMTKKERVEMIGKGSRKYAEAGFVFAADASVMPATLRIYQDALDAGELKIRVYTMNHVDFCEHLIKAGISFGFGNDRLRIGSIKIFIDGGISNRTAALRAPYLTPPYDCGLKVLSHEDLINMFHKFNELGYQIAVHCQGDDGLADLLDAYETILGPYSDNPLRHRIEHAGCLYPDLLKRAADMNILIAVQPSFIGELGDGILEALGQQRAHGLFPYQSMLQAGICLGGSSDCPVTLLDPRLGLRDAVLRRTPSGETLGQDESLTMDQALRMYTRGAAYLSFDEHLNGTIEVGKRADFTVMDTDPRTVNPEEVPDIPIVMTVVGGEIVFVNPSAIVG